MARFQLHHGVYFYKKQDIIGDLEAPDDVLFLWKWNPLCDWNRVIGLDFEKYVAKGVMATFFAVTLYTSGAN